MAFRASALKGAVAAAICVALVMCWVGKPAEGAPSCAIRRCISECPSKCNKKAASSCGAPIGGIDEAKCKFNCGMGCKANCPKGTTCDCDSACDSHCKSTPGPTYTVCMSMVFHGCKDSCEKECRGEKVNS
ncbi:unnamed protein product [Miscanthus lutarioriparius]|uniref:4Fe-4S ferredoxin-type domain-containing protein n=1 Tax=Miscanthus lutarioriparius TaxID=422564 RepID=A0A811RIT1_9POAL|nr:unnamed protein product [Miscanthus lutarioriparius]